MLLRKYMYCMILLLYAAAACKKVDAVQLGPDYTREQGPMKIYLTDSVFTLRQVNEQNTAVVIGWSESARGSLENTSYRLLIDKSKTLTSPYIVNMGARVFSQSFTVEELNNVAVKELGLAADSTKTYPLYGRIVAQGTTSNDTSAVFTLTVKPYVWVFMIPSQLYLLGGAAGTNATPANGVYMAPAVNADGTRKSGEFRWMGYLADTGTFRFITNLNNSYPGFTRGKDAQHLAFIKEAGQTETLFSVTTAGIYSIQVNLNDTTISMQKIEKLPLVNADLSLAPGVAVVKDTYYPWLNWPVLYDGNMDNFIDDGYGPNNAWGGMDLGAAKGPIGVLRFAPRGAEWAALRTVDGHFDGAGKSDFSDADVLYTIKSMPAWEPGKWNTISLWGTKKYRYFRYVAPLSSGVNISEIELYLYP